MKCINARQKLTLHISQDLPQEQTERLEQHLNDCATCRAFRDELVLQRELMAKLNAPPVPELNVAGIIQKHDPTALGPLTWRQRLAGFVVASLIVTFILAWTWESIPSDENTLLTQLPQHVTMMPVVSSTPQVPTVQPDPASESKVETSPTVITLYTDDPDVVIHWFGD